jgi:2-polyprenyl-6-methoxyphenol hydroxylase-like FAD-dependent oxidoreductase
VAAATATSEGDPARGRGAHDAPVLGQGACQAIEDAVALRSANSVDHALETYERVRYARTAQIVNRSRAAERIAHLKWAWQRRLRDTALAHTPAHLRWRQRDATITPAPSR